MQATISHVHLGELHYEAALGWYEGSATVATEQVCLYLSAESEEEVERSLAVAASCWPTLVAFLASAKSFAANNLLDLKNGEWCEDDGAQISHQQFVERLATESILFHPDGTVELTFADGGLFFGHVVTVSAEEGSFTDANLAG